MNHVKDEVCIASLVEGVTVNAGTCGCRQLGQYVMIFQEN